MKSTILLHLPDDLRDLAKAAAQADGRSLSNWIRRAIQAAVLRAAHEGTTAQRAAIDQVVRMATTPRRNRRT